MHTKIAFLFMTKQNSECSCLWNDFFTNADKNKYKIFCHAKHPENVTDFLKSHIIDEYIPTEWGQPSLFHVEYKLIKKALYDETITHFILLSGDTAPLTNFDNIYNSIIKEKKGFLDSYGIVPYQKDKNLFNPWYLHNQFFIITKEIANLFVKNYLKILFNFSSIYNIVDHQNYRMLLCLDENWINILFNLVLKYTKIEDFFFLEKKFIFMERITYDGKIFHKQMNKELDMKHFISNPYIYDTKKYFEKREYLEKEGYFFIRKVHFNKKE